MIMVVDSSKPENIQEARFELHRMANEEELRDVRILIYANKQDLPNVMSVHEITEKLNLRGLRQEWYIIASSATSGDGLYEGLEWLRKRIMNE